jgi:hypothetical protein
MIRRLEFALAIDAHRNFNRAARAPGAANPISTATPPTSNTAR